MPSHRRTALSLSETARTIIKEGAQATPPTSVLVAKAQGVTFTADDLATYMAIFLLALQIGWFFWSNVIKPWRTRRAIRLADARRRLAQEAHEHTE
jgi:hypothetical protein